MMVSILVILSALKLLAKQAFLISGNETISGGNDGIDIDSVENAFVTISDNGSITGFDDGIVIDGPIKAASKIIISDNTLIKARDGDGIEIGDVIGTEIAGETNVLISGNETISGGNNGILFGSLENTLLTISNNDAIIGEYKDGIEINGPVKAASKIIISNNTLIKGRNDGIDIGDIIGTEIAGETSVLISGNETISGGNDGIDIDSVENAFVTISDNGSITGFDDGIVY